MEGARRSGGAGEEEDPHPTLSRARERAPRPRLRGRAFRSRFVGKLRKKLDPGSSPG
jgi:hypothetical protein